MKKRIIKKNLNRFITPLLEDLPKTQTYANLIEDGDTISIIAQKQHVIVNGEVVEPGEQSPICRDLLLNIRRTAEEIERIKIAHKYVFHRIGPEVRGNSVRVRLITE